MLRALCHSEQGDNIATWPGNTENGWGKPKSRTGWRNELTKTPEFQYGQIQSPAAGRRQPPVAGQAEKVSLQKRFWCTPAGMKASHVLGCISKSTGSRSSDIQPGEGKVKTPIAIITHQVDGHREDRASVFMEVRSKLTQSNRHKMQEGNLLLSTGYNIFTRGLVKHWDKDPEWCE